jgi:hypothetical protein
MDDELEENDHLNFSATHTGIESLRKKLMNREQEV